MSNVYWVKHDIETAKALVEEAIVLRKQIGDMAGTAYDTVKLGQLAQRVNQREQARNYYREGLALFQRLGAAPQIAQVENLLASLDHQQSSSEPDLASQLAQLPPEARAQVEAQLAIAAQLRQAISNARNAAAQQAWGMAIEQQAIAVRYARELAAATHEREALVQLSVLLYNLAGYYQQADRHAEAIVCLEEVVALDQQTGHEDLAADRQALAQARQLARDHAATALTDGLIDAPADEEAAGISSAAVLAQLSPAMRVLVDELDPTERAQLLATLAALGPEERERAEQAFLHFAALAPEEQAALVNRTPLQGVEAQLLPQLDGLVAAHHAGQLEPAQLANALQTLTDQLIPQLAADEALGAGRHALVALLGCLVAHLRGAPVPPVPALYVAQWQQWLEL